MGKPFWKTAFKDWGIVNYIQDVATGDNKVGGVLHGVLDNLPIANEPLGKLVKALISGDWLKAKEEFGFEAKTTLEEGIQKTYEWYLQTLDLIQEDE